MEHCTQCATSVVSSQSPQKQSAVDALITAYRRYGHLNAKIDPLNSPIKNETRLTLAYHGLSDADLNETFELNKGLAVLHFSLKS